jgi:lysozyme
MRTSDDGVRRLEVREGKRNKAYRDVKGIWTIGVGHTGPNVYEGLAWTDQQIEDALRVDLSVSEDAINRYVTVPLKQCQFDALVSFIFNVGVLAFRRSTLLKVLNRGDYENAAECFDMWHIPPEIIGRRDSEKEQFLGE